MSTVDPLETLRRRAVRHALEDGAADLVFGLYALIVACATQRQAFLGVAVAYLAAMGPAWQHLHHQVSSRRTGYAELPQQPPSPMLSVILLSGAATLGVVAGVTLLGGKLWSLDLWPPWTSVLAASVLAAGFLYTAVTSGLRRFGVLAALSLGTSVFFWLFPFGPRINPSDRLTLTLFVVAAALLVSGAVTMARFVRQHPAVAGGDGHVL